MSKRRPTAQIWVQGRQPFVIASRAMQTSSLFMVRAAVSRLGFAAILLVGCDDATPATATDATVVDGAVITVASCQQLAMAMAANCASTPIRQCIWRGYAQLCATGNTRLLVESMRCLDATTCRTFSDSNGADACLTAAHASSETPAVRAALTSMCTSCDAGMCSSAGATAEIFPYLSDANIALVTACRGAACEPETTVMACRNSPAVAPFIACLSM